MTIAKPGSWLAGYILGTRVVRGYKVWGGWAVGKGNVKKQIRLWINSEIHGMNESNKGFIDAILDSVN